MNSVQLACAIRVHLAARGLTMRELSARLGVGPQWLRRRLRHQQPWRTLDVLAVARALDVSTAAIADSQDLIRVLEEARS